MTTKLGKYITPKHVACVGATSVVLILLYASLLPFPPTVTMVTNMTSVKNSVQAALQHIAKINQIEPWPPKPHMQQSYRAISASKVATMSSKPVAQSSKPLAEPSKSKVETVPVKSIIVPSISVTPPSKSVAEPSKPAAQSSKPAAQPSKPAEQPSKPAEQPSKPATHPLKCNDPFKEEFDNKRTFICSQPIGGLGNCMFVYASSYGIASKLNRTLVNPVNNKMVPYFNLSAKLVKDYTCVSRGIKGKGSNRDCSFDKTMFDISPGDNYHVGTYLQSYKYFEHVFDDIRRQYIFTWEIRHKAATIIQSAISFFNGKRDSPEKPVLVGVHVRRGDMVNSKFGYSVATPEYLTKAAAYFRSNFSKILFVVCSNDMKWTKENIYGDDVFYVEGHRPEEDMAVLVSCDHSLTTVGSFSWWTGFLTGGITLYYQWPAVEGSSLRKHYSINYADYFLPQWIGMS